MSMNKKEFRKNQIQKLQKLSKTWEKKLDELNLYKELFYLYTLKIEHMAYPMLYNNRKRRKTQGGSIGREGGSRRRSGARSRCAWRS